VDLFPRIAKNSAAIFISKASEIICSFIRIALISRYLGPDSFGQYSWILAFILIFSPLMNFEINQILTREIAQDKKMAGRYFGNALISKWVISLCFLIPILGYINIKRGGVTEPYVALALLITLGSEICVQHTILFEAIFNAYERMEYNALLNLSNHLLGLGLVFLAVHYDLGFLGVFWAISIPNLIRALVGYFVAQKVFVKPDLRPDIQVIRHFFHETLPLTGAAFLFGLSFRIDILILSYFKSPAEVALFSLSDTLIKRLQIVPIALGIALFPLLSRLASTDRPSLERIYERSFKLLFIISLPVTVILISFSGRIIDLISGPSFLPAANSLAVLAGSFSLTFPVFLLSTILIALRKQKWIILSSGACLAINGLLDLILIPPYSFMGASFATLTGEVVNFSLLFLFVSQFLIRIPLLGVLLKPGLCSVLLWFWLIQFSDKDISWQSASLFLGAFFYLIPLMLLGGLRQKKFDFDLFGSKINFFKKRMENHDNRED
jgi:O-antigen/teichoic acid export membrane protein